MLCDNCVGMLPGGGMFTESCEWDKKMRYVLRNQHRNRDAVKWRHS